MIGCLLRTRTSFWVVLENRDQQENETGEWSITSTTTAGRECCVDRRLEWHDRPTPEKLNAAMRNARSPSSCAEDKSACVQKSTLLFSYDGDIVVDISHRNSLEIQLVSMGQWTIRLNRPEGGANNETQKSNSFC
jgi:hypothetical protein